MVLQKRSLEMLQLIGTLSQQVLAAPHVKWREVMSMVGDAMNIPNLGDLIDQARVMQMQQGAGQSPQGAPGENPLAQILARNRAK
jgi:hypothetical protein